MLQPGHCFDGSMMILHHVCWVSCKNPGTSQIQSLCLCLRIFCWTSCTLIKIILHIFLGYLHWSLPPVYDQELAIVIYSTKISAVLSNWENVSSNRFPQPSSYPMLCPLVLLPGNQGILGSFNCDFYVSVYVDPIIWVMCQ